MELREINSGTRWGIAAIFGTVLLTYSGHWWGKAVAHEKAELAAYKSNVAAQVSDQQATQKRNYTLEIRGVGIAVHGWHQSSIWREIVKKNSNFVSIYPSNAMDYNPGLSSRETTRETLKKTS